MTQVLARRTASARMSLEFPMKTARYSVLAVALLSLAAQSRATEITLVPQRKAVDESAAAVATFTFRPVGGVAKDLAVPHALVLRLDQPGPVELPSGSWSLDVESPDWWHARQYVIVGSAALTLTAPLWRAAAVSGTATLRDGSAPGEVTIRFSSDSGDSAGLRGETSCPVVEKRFRCQVAAGLLDLHMRSRGCVAHYAWGKGVPPGGTLDVGTLEFERGASITGTVSLGRGVATPTEKLRVKALPNGLTPQSSKLTQFIAAPTSKGFFHLDGVPPGEYVVTAEGPNRLASQRVVITVVGEAEVLLREPLLVDVPRTLSVDVLPLLDPEQKPWLVTLAREVQQRHYEMVSERAVDSTGAWTAQVQPGHYNIQVSTSGGAKWESRDVDIDADTRVAIALTSHELRGSILLGKKPLAAKLIFGGEYGSQSLPTKSDEEGHFNVRLPNTEAKSWDVTVDAVAPRVKRTLRVDLPEKPDNEVEIHLRDTIVFGTVVDESGKPAGADVGVNMTHEREVIQEAAVARDGTFAFHGVDPGAYSVQAEGFLLESDTVPVHVPEDGMTEELRLVVKPVRKIVGRVYSGMGPVAGARVQVAPADVPSLFAAFRDTDERGEFSTVVPWNCQRIDVYVMAPGFDYRAFRTTIHEGNMLNIPVDQRGGVLTARWPRGEAAMLFHSGAMLWPDTLAWVLGGRRQSSDKSEELMATPLDPGVYSLCVVPQTEVSTLRFAPPPANDPRCTSAFLPPFGEIVIEHN